MYFSLWSKHFPSIGTISGKGTGKNRSYAYAALRTASGAIPVRRDPVTGRMTDADEKLASLFGSPFFRGSFSDVTIHSVHPSDRPSFDQALKLFLDDGGVMDLRYRLADVNGGYTWVREVAIQMSSEEEPGEPSFGFLFDVSAEMYCEQRVSDLRLEVNTLLTIDGLTSLANRQTFLRVLETEWRQAALGRHPLSLVIFDVDYFREFNRRHGYREADSCLAIIAERLRNPVRTGDLVARLGGEEFVLLLPDTDAALAEEIAIQKQICVADEQIVHHDSPISRYVTVSFGVATRVPHPSESPSVIIDDALQAIPRLKKA